MTEVLIDGWPDHCIEEHAWVAISAAATEAQAIARLQADFPREDNFDVEVEYRVTGRSFQRPAGEPVPGQEGMRAVLEDRACEHCDGSSHGECDECYGTGKDGAFYSEESEGLPWEGCNADAPGAVEFWTIEAVEVSS